MYKLGLLCSRQGLTCVVCRALARQEAQTAASEASTERRWLAELPLADGKIVRDIDEEEPLPGVWRP